MANRPKNLNQKIDVLMKQHVFLSNLRLAIVFAVLITEPMRLLIGYSATKAEVACREMPFLLLLSFIFLTICFVFVVKACASQQKYLDEGGATKISAFVKYRPATGVGSILGKTDVFFRDQRKTIQGILTKCLWCASIGVSC